MKITRTFLYSNKENKLTVINKWKSNEAFDTLHLTQQVNGKLRHKLQPCRIDLSNKYPIGYVYPIINLK